MTDRTQYYADYYKGHQETIKQKRLQHKDELFEYIGKQDFSKLPIRKAMWLVKEFRRIAEKERIKKSSMKAWKEYFDKNKRKRK
jgi:hypothetical protein